MDQQDKATAGFRVESGMIVAGRYEVRERLGTGGMGVVLRVIDRELNNEVVALKLLHPHLAEDEEVFQRFRNEVLVARTLTHPNIVRIHDIGRAEQGFYYISMEFVDGETVKDKLTRVSTGAVPKLGFSEAVSLFFQILTGVAYAHAKGVVHRDLKPANVMINKEGEIKLADFGTARILGMDTSLTKVGQIIGTPDYMSPEQIRGEKLDASCDIYALGIIGYELATNRKPFPGETAVAVVFKHMNDPIPDFATPNSGIPLWFQQAVRKACEKDKSKRFSSAAEFAATIAHYGGDLIQGSGSLSMEGVAGVDLMGKGGKLQTAGRKKSHVAQEGEFELGAADSPEEDEWSLGFRRAESDATMSHKAPPPATARGPERKERAEKSEQRRHSPFAMGAAIFASFVVLVLGIGRFHGGMHQWLQTSFSESAAFPDSAKNIFAGLFGLTIAEPEEEKSADAAAVEQTSQEASARESLEKEIFAEDSGAASVEGAPDTETAAVAESAQQAAAEIPPPEPDPDAANVSARLEFRHDRNTTSSTAFETIELDRVGWIADVQGVSKSWARDSKDKIVREFKINVLDAKAGKLLQTLTPSEVLTDDRRDGMRLTGGFKALEKNNAGTFKLALYYKDKQLTSKELSVYSTASRVEPTQPTGELSPTGMQPTGLPSAGMQPTGLPPAAGGSSSNASSLDEPGAVSGIESAAGITMLREQYSGSMTMANPDGSKGKVGITLDLEIEGTTVKGSASIETLGSFQAFGRVHPSGLEITLHGSEKRLLLSGSKRGALLKGLYSIEGEQGRNAWNVNKTN